MRLIYYWVAMHASDESADRQQALDKAMSRTRELMDSLPSIPESVLESKTIKSSPPVSGSLLYLQ